MVSATVIVEIAVKVGSSWIGCGGCVDHGGSDDAAGGNNDDDDDDDEGSDGNNDDDDDADVVIG